MYPPPFIGALIRGEIPPKIPLYHLVFSLPHMVEYKCRVRIGKILNLPG
jgi:hypothetical protein